MENKKIAKYELSFIGGEAKVNRYYNQDESKFIDIFISKNGYFSTGITCATIGLNSLNIGLVNDGKEIKIELIALGMSDEFKIENIIATCAFEIIDFGTCYYGMIIPDVVTYYVKNTEMKHILLLSPIFWDKYIALEGDNEIVSWLLLIPISNGEAQYIQEQGVDAFDRLLEEKEVNIADYKRKSIV